MLHNTSPDPAGHKGMVRRRRSAPLPVREDPAVAAEVAGLSYAATEGAGINRRRAGKGFSYRDAKGGLVTKPATLARIRALAIPPAWRSVWICPDPDGHIQAMGFDEKGRRQYRYHARFREVRDEAKYQHMIAFAEALPKLRAQVDEDMRRPGAGRRQVLATVVHLLETTMIRVGNRAYAKSNQSYGLTTLEARHVDIAGTRLRFSFKGKSGKEWKLDIRDPRIVRIVKSCQELPGQGLFSYRDEDGEPQSVTSADVNAYLREITGADITAKDFRTWNGTVMAAMALAEAGPEPHALAAARNVTRVVKDVAVRLGNTPTICRKCYVHPEIVRAYLDGALKLVAGVASEENGLQPEERAVLAFLRRRIAATA